jgi:hypothetical protein
VPAGTVCGRNIMKLSKRTRRWLAGGAWGTAAVLGLNALVLSWASDVRAGGAAPYPNLKPYTVYLVGTVYPADGSTPVAGGQYVQALRSDGAYMTRAAYLDASRVGKSVVQHIVTWPSGDRVEMDVVRELRSTTKNANLVFTRALRDPSSQCGASYNGRRFRADQPATGETLHGYPTFQIQAGALHSWFAPTLSCALVRSRLGSGAKGETVQDAVRIVEGEPAEDLFQVPNTYDEVVPSVLYRLAPGSSAAASRDVYYAQHPSDRRPPTTERRRQ